MSDCEVLDADTAAENQKLQRKPAAVPNRPLKTTEMKSSEQATLYDEDPNSPQGRRYAGSVVWRTEAVKGNDVGQRADIAVRADIYIPDRKLKMTLSFRRNLDPSLPASHRISPVAALETYLAF
jgi:hypothetical protein